MKKIMGGGKKLLLSRMTSTDSKRSWQAGVRKSLCNYHDEDWFR